MEVGSIVQCIEKSKWVDWDPTIKIPVVGKMYTVRGFYVSTLGNSHVGVYLEEIKNTPIDANSPIFNVEPSFLPRIFREIVPPQEEDKELVEDLEGVYGKDNYI